MSRELQIADMVATLEKGAAKERSELERDGLAYVLAWDNGLCLNRYGEAYYVGGFSAYTLRFRSKREALAFQAARKVRNGTGQDAAPIYAPELVAANDRRRAELILAFREMASIG